MKSPSLSSGRGLLGPLVLGACVIAAVVWILGPSLPSIVATAREKARRKLQELVDNAEVERNRASSLIEEAREKVPEIAEQTARAEIVLRQQESKLAEAKAIADTREAEISFIRNCLADGKPVRTVSGRVLPKSEISGLVRARGENLELARQKISWHEDLCRKRQADLARLKAQREELPIRVRNLTASLSYLDEKLGFYREMQDELATMSGEDSDFEGIAAEAERVLEQAHRTVDVEIAGLNARLECQQTAETIIDTGEKASEDLVRLCDGYLGKPDTDVVLADR